MNKYMATTFAFIFTFLQFFPASLLTAAPDTISGSIQKISPAGNNRYEVTILSDKEQLKLLVDETTLIETLTPAENVKPGQKIVPRDASQTKEVKEVKGMQGVGGKMTDMPDSTKKFLGLPNIPKIPSVPKVPQVPSVPKIPQVPKGLPAGKEGAAPAAGGTAGGAAGGGMPQSMMQQMAAQAQGGPQGGAPQEAGGPAGGKTEKEEPKEPPREKVDTLAAMIPKTIAASEGGQKQPEVDSGKGAPQTPKLIAKRVVGLNATPKGLVIKLEGEQGIEELLVPANEKVFTVLSIQDLRAKMNIRAEVTKDAQKSIAARITVL